MIMGSIKKRPSGYFALLGLPIYARAVASTLLFFSWKAFVAVYSTFNIIAESLKKIKSQSTARPSNHTLRLPEKALTYQNRAKKSQHGLLQNPKTGLFKTLSVRPKTAFSHYFLLEPKPTNHLLLLRHSKGH